MTTTNNGETVIIQTDDNISFIIQPNKNTNVIIQLDYKIDAIIRLDDKTPNEKANVIIHPADMINAIITQLAPNFFCKAASHVVSHYIISSQFFNRILSFRFGCNFRISIKVKRCEKPLVFPWKRNYFALRPRA
jgi:hypothetical protein